MKCPQCQHENSVGQKFCGECGAGLATGCAACGAANPPGQNFCGECGAPLSEARATPKFASPDDYTPKHLADKILTSRGSLEGERKQVVASRRPAREGPSAKPGPVNGMLRKPRKSIYWG